MEYNKISDHEAEIVITEEKSQVVNLSQLIYDRDSLIRTIELNNQDVTARNAVCQNMIDELNTKIDALRSIGVIEEPVNNEE